MGKVLVAYTTKHGSTTDVAQAIAEELQGSGAVVDVWPIGEAGDLAAYDAVVVGGPMILGWHRETVRFLVKNQQALSQKRVAYFFTGKALTQTGEDRLGDTAVFLDPVSAKPPKKPGKVSLEEKFSTPHHYLGPVFKKVPAVKPVAAGLFGGDLDYAKLNLLEVLFVRVVVKATAGDSRNWEAIRTWARGVAPLLGV